MIDTITGRCWANGSQAFGLDHPTLDTVRCRHCNRKLTGTGARAPHWHEDGTHQLAAECQSCTDRRHRDCPCKEDRR